MEKKIVVITGPSGAGKTSIAKYLTDKFEIPKTITHTTRNPRKDEIDGVDYYFENDESFSRLDLLEFVEYAGNKYGSSFQALERAWDKSPNKLANIVIDTVGAITYHEKLANKAIIIFVTVSTPELLAKRLLQRGDDPQFIKERTSSADFQRDMKIPEEVKSVSHVINNDDWEEAKKQIDALINNLL